MVLAIDEIAGYILKKIKEKGKFCPPCLIKLTGQLRKDDQRHNFISQKNDEHAKTGLLTPSNAMLGLVEKFELEYNKIIDNVIHNPGVKNNLISALLQVKLGNLQCKKCLVDHAMARLYV